MCCIGHTSHGNKTISSILCEYMKFLFLKMDSLTPHLLTSCRHTCNALVPFSTFHFLLLPLVLTSDRRKRAGEKEVEDRKLTKENAKSRKEKRRKKEEERKKRKRKRGGRIDHNHPPRTLAPFPTCAPPRLSSSCPSPCPRGDLEPKEQEAQEHQRRKRKGERERRKRKGERGKPPGAVAQLELGSSKARKFIWDPPQKNKPFSVHVQE